MVHERNREMQAKKHTLCHGGVLVLQEQWQLGCMLPPCCPMAPEFSTASFTVDATWQPGKTDYTARAGRRREDREEERKEETFTVELNKQQGTKGLERPWASSNKPEGLQTTEGCVYPLPCLLCPQPKQSELMQEGWLRLSLCWPSISSHTSYLVLWFPSGKWRGLLPIGAVHRLLAAGQIICTNHLHRHSHRVRVME